MTERFTLKLDSEWWVIGDNTIQVNEHGYRDDLTGDDRYRGLKQELTEQETVDLLNELNDENRRLKSDLTHTKVLLDSMQDKYGGLLKLVHGFNGDV